MRKKIVLLFIMLNLGFWPWLAHGDIYRWQEANGTVNFSDKSHQDAEKVKVDETQTYTVPKVINQPREKATESITKRSSKQRLQKHYQLLTIISPKRRETIWNNQGKLEVVVLVEPRLQPDDKFQLYLDGRLVNKGQEANFFELNNVYRGTHKVYAVVVNGQNKEIVRSASVTFYVHQARVKKQKP